MGWSRGLSRYVKPVSVLDDHDGYSRSILPGERDAAGITFMTLSSFLLSIFGPSQALGTMQEAVQHKRRREFSPKME